MNHKRVILCGPTAAGKSFIRDKFKEKGYKTDVSYTSRLPREGETDGIDYKFISEKEFKNNINDNLFYEWVQYGNNYYGTGRFEWENSDVFIMETDGISKITMEDRKNSVVIFVNTPLKIRAKRMYDRGWDTTKNVERINTDIRKFEGFKDYDFEISSNKTIL